MLFCDREVLMTPSKQPPHWLDPFAAWQALLRQNYRFWGNYLDYSMGTLLRNQQLLDLNALALETALRSKQQVDRVVEATVRQSGLPTKDDMERILHRLNEIESRLQELSEQAERLRST
jgi:hypothetical protein